MSIRSPIDWHVRITRKVASLIRSTIPFPLTHLVGFSSFRHPVFSPVFILHRRGWQKRGAFYFLSSYLVTAWRDSNCTAAFHLHPLQVRRKCSAFAWRAGNGKYDRRSRQLLQRAVDKNDTYSITFQTYSLRKRQTFTSHHPFASAILLSLTTTTCHWSSSRLHKTREQWENNIARNGPEEGSMDGVNRTDPLYPTKSM